MGTFSDLSTLFKVCVCFRDGFGPMSNDEQATRFDGLVRPHLGELYRLAYRLTGKSEDAEDLVQELMVRLYRRPQELEQVETLRPWLLRALYNLYVDAWRRKRRSPFGYLDPHPWEDVLENTAAIPGPEHTAQMDALRSEVLQALYGLSREHRALLVLHDMEERSLPELAELLKLPIGTLKSRLFRARRKLRVALEHGNRLALSDVITDEVSEYGL